jgi:hypothetical protein
MTAEADKHVKLRTLMATALETCLQLKALTEDSHQVFLGDDDEKILNVLDRREEIIQRLIGIEKQIDLIFNEAAEYDGGRRLPEDVDQLRQSARRVLDDISTGDMEIMKLVSSRMQAYKTETLKARNRKNISAYIRTPYAEQSGESVNLIK